MPTVHQIGSLTSVLFVGALLSAGCMSAVSSDEKTNEEGFEQTGSKHGNGGHHKPKPKPPKPTPAPTPPGCGTCIDGSIGDGITCQDTSSLKVQIADACKQAGLSLTAVKYDQKGCAANEASEAFYSCCPTPPPPPPPPDGCTYGELGDGLVCVDPATLQQQAEDACLLTGVPFAYMKSLQDCPGGASTTAYYACCPPPPPDPCTHGELGDGLVCIDPATLQQQAEDACLLTGLPLSYLKAFQDCAGGGSTKAFYGCCPPPPPDPCTYGELGDGLVCVDPATLQQQAEDACLLTGLPLAYTKSLQDCPGGASTKAWYGCCPAPQPK
jgi:hypothetical protein